MELLLLIMLGVLLTIWIIYAIIYTKELFSLFSLYNKQRDSNEVICNELPLLIEIMRSYVLKSDEVFQKTIHRRHELLFEKNESHWESLRDQITFLLAIADRHPDLLSEKRFLQTSENIIIQMKKNAQLHEEYQQALAHWQTIRRKSLLCLFPGYFFIRSPLC